MVLRAVPNEREKINLMHVCVSLSCFAVSIVVVLRAVPNQREEKIKFNFECLIFQ